MDTYATILADAGIQPVLDLTRQPADLWLFFADQADRDAAEWLLYGRWVELADRSIQLNYRNTWIDVAGAALHLAHSEAFSRVEPARVR